MNKYCDTNGQENTTICSTRYYLFVLIITHKLQIYSIISYYQYRKKHSIIGHVQIHYYNIDFIMLLLQKSKESLLAILDIVKVKVSLGLRKHICLSPHTHLGSGPSSNLQMFDLVSVDLVQRGERSNSHSTVKPCISSNFSSPRPGWRCGGSGFRTKQSILNTTMTF